MLSNSLQQKCVLSTAHQELNDLCLLEKQWQFFFLLSASLLEPATMSTTFFEGINRMNQL